MASERGSAAIVVVASLALSALLTAFGADLAAIARGRARAQAGADSAALAAAQELVAPGESTPEAVAAEYAERNGARLVSCRCDPGSSEIVVTVEVAVSLPAMRGIRTVRATARAVVEAGIAPGRGVRSGS